MFRKNILSISVAAIIMFLSLTGSDSFSRIKIPVIPFLDKIVHSAMYFTLMLSLIFENRTIVASLRSYFLLAAIPFIYGALIELLQIIFTTDRQGDIFDIFFNLAGIILAVLFWKIIRLFSRKNFK